MRIILTELAWAAGFFDGEGCTSSHHNGHTPKLYPQVSISQVDRRPLDRFVAAVGGGRVRAVAERATSVGTRRGYRVDYGSTKAIGVLCQLWEHLSEPKREQATRVAERIVSSCA